MEIEVYGMLRLNELLVLSLVSPTWRARITWFLKSYYHGGRVDLAVHLHGKDRHYRALLDTVNVRDCSIRTISPVDETIETIELFQRVVSRAQDTVQSLCLAHVGMLARFNDMSMRFPRLASLTVDSTWYLDYRWDIKETEAFLSAHSSTLTDLQLPKRSKSEAGNRINFAFASALCHCLPRTI